MYLKILKSHDVTQNYVNWFLDNEVTKYSENQYRKFSLKGQQLYVNDCLKNKDIKLY